MNAQKALDIKVGDLVKVIGSTQHPFLVGRVLSVSRFQTDLREGPDGGTCDAQVNFYIEISRLGGGYAYWKQGLDGGLVYYACKHCEGEGETSYRRNCEHCGGTGIGMAGGS